MSRQFAALVALTAACVTASGEDFFELLEPEAAAKQVSHEVVIGPELPRVNDKAGEQPDEAETTEQEPLRVAQQVELVPSPAAITAPDEEGFANEDIASVLGAAPPRPSRSRSTNASPLSRPIVALTLDTHADPELVEQGGNLPEQFAIRDLAAERFGSWDQPHADASATQPRFALNHFRFAAPAVYSRPLYFEQPNLERYGHHIALCEQDHLSQSALSAAHFFATVPVLPYKMGATPPDECSYVLGVYRPGSCNPHQLVKPILSARGLVYEAAAVTGLVFLVP